MTLVLARNNQQKKVRVTISGRKFSGAGLAGILERKQYTKHLVPAVYSAASSWICPTPSWSNMKIVEMTTSEICAAEFADWTIFDTDFGNDDFLGECMGLFNVWLWCAEEEAPWDAWFSWKNFTERDLITAYGPNTLRRTMTAIKATPSWLREAGLATSHDSSTSLCSTWSCLTTDWVPFACRCDEELEEGMRLFAAWSTEAAADDEDDAEVLVEPESLDSLLMPALVSTKDLLPAPSAGLLRVLARPDLLMDSLAVLLFETRHFTVLNPRFGPSVLISGNWLNAGFLNAGPVLLALPAPALNAGSGLLALPAPPAWMLALEHDRETDAPRSVSTVSLHSGWDAVSARVSSSSIFNLFSTSTTSASSLFPDPTGISSSSIFNLFSTSTTSASSLFPDPTGFPSLDSTVAPWETPSTESFTSMTGSSFTTSASSVAAAYPAGAPSLRSPSGSLFTSASSIFADPTEESSAVSIPSNFFVAPLRTTTAPRVSFYQVNTPSSCCTSSASSVAGDTVDDVSSFSEHVCTTSCFDGTTSGSSFPVSSEASASASSLFPDPTSAHSCSSSCFKVAPSTASASSIFPDPRSAHSCTASCFDISSSSTTSASSGTSSSALCPDCGVRHEVDDTTSASSESSVCSNCGVRHSEDEDDESNASTTSSSSFSSEPPHRFGFNSRFGHYSLVPSSAASSASTTSSGYESDVDAEEEPSESVIVEPTEESVQSADFVEEPVLVEEEPAVLQPVTTVSAATQTQAPDEEVCGLDKYLALFDEVHEMRRKLLETMEEGGEAAVPANPLEPEQTYSHEEAAIISRMAIAWDALLEDTARLVKKAFEEKRRKIRFLM